MSFQKLTPEVLRLHKGVSFTGITTVFLCHDGRGRLFMSKRSANTRDEHGRWDAGGGGLKHGVSIEDNLRRELLEEYNVTPKRLDFVGYFDAFRQTPEGLPTHWLAMCFAVLVDPEKVKINETEMVDDSGWFRLDDLPSPLHSQYKVFLSKYRDTLAAFMNDPRA